MSREIKFRAWNGKTMLYAGDIDKMFKPKDGFNQIQYRPISALAGDSNDYVWMQYTGLKDKNGKEIYEGDIVKVLRGGWASKSNNDQRTLDEYLDSLTEKYEVVFTQGEFLGKRNTNDEWNIYICLIAQKHGYIEIIGNIYEHPELLQPNHPTGE